MTLLGICMQEPGDKSPGAEDHDPKLVMANFAAQTGLTVTEDTAGKDSFCQT